MGNFRCITQRLRNMQNGEIDYSELRNQEDARVRDIVSRWPTQEELFQRAGESRGAHLRTFESVDSVHPAVWGMVRAANALMEPLFGEYDEWYFRAPEKNLEVLVSLSPQQVQHYYEACVAYFDASREVRSEIESGTDSAKLLDAIDVKIAVFKVQLESKIEGV